MFGVLFFFLVPQTCTVDSLLVIGREYHDKAVEGETEAIKKAEDCFKKALKLEPENPLVNVWLGSLLTVKARDAGFPLVKLRYLNQGINHMDKAVSLEPSNREVRMVRALNNLELPMIFDRLDTVIVDLEYLIESNQEESAEFLVYLGTAYKKKSDIEKARDCWVKAMSATSDTILIKRAETLMAETEE